MNHSQESANYIYAFIQGDLRADPGNCGLNNARVYPIAKNGLTAIVSNVPDKRVRPERRNIAAHQAVLRTLLQETTPLPVSFGIVAKNRQGVELVLSKHHQVLSEHFQEVRGKVEMGLRATWDVPNIFEYFIDTHAELKSTRDRYFGRHREPTREEKMELGRMFEQLLRNDREQHTAYVRGVLQDYASRIEECKCAKEADIMHLACLVDRESLERFEEGVFQAAEGFDNNFAFDFNGPWAPHNFVHLELEL